MWNLQAARLVQVVKEGNGQASAPSGCLVFGWIDHTVKRRAPSVIGPSSHEVTQIDHKAILLGKPSG